MTLTAKEVLSRTWRGIKTTDRFWEKVNKRAGSECWLWTGSKTHFGYGIMHIGPDAWVVHRISWVIHFGEIPPGLYVLHRCDVPNCVRPSHLWLGTYTDNNQDCLRKGRRIMPKGECVASSKLTGEDVITIRNLFDTGKHSKAGIARMFGVTDTMIGNIIRRKWWRHIPLI